MSKLNISKGEWKVSNYNGFTTVRIPNKGCVSVLESFNYDEDEANATLIADAGNTYNKCGMLPSELLSILENIKSLDLEEIYPGFENEVGLNKLKTK